ncbi:hypothetical protein MHYP_G00172760 [Metynnis hypsauchen]
MIVISRPGRVTWLSEIYPADLLSTIAAEQAFRETGQSNVAGDGEATRRSPSCRLKCDPIPDKRISVSSEHDGFLIRTLEEYGAKQPESNKISAPARGKDVTSAAWRGG